MDCLLWDSVQFYRRDAKNAAFRGDAQVTNHTIWLFSLRNPAPIPPLRRKSSLATIALPRSAPHNLHHLIRITKHIARRVTEYHEKKFLFRDRNIVAEKATLATSMTNNFF